MDDEEKKLCSGHRVRLREKFQKSRSSLTDAEILELLLFSFIPYKDTKIIAKKLLAVFRTFDAIITADPLRLCEIPGVGKSTAFSLNVLGEFFIRRLHQDIEKQPVLNSWESVLNYCQLILGFKEEENVHILFLNKRFCLIADEILFSGTIDETPFYVRNILKRALELCASALIVVHNHPSGNPSPSHADIQQTRALLEAAEKLDIQVCDHIIVTKEKYTSLRALNVLFDQ